MFKHILIATDGSELSERAALKAVALAKEMNARVTAVTVTAPWSSFAVGEVAIAVPERDYEERAETNAWTYLNRITDAAKAAGVPRSAVHLRHATPYRAIVEAAATHACDLIAVGAHGRRGLEGFLIGSETQKVLTHAKVPVLVYRE
jgi:nucleotide-binding universal stress UspA family protein